MHLSDVEATVIHEEEVRKNLAAADRSSNWKGLQVLVALMLLASWFLYHFVLNENKMVFFSILLVMAIALGWHLLKKLSDDGVQVLNDFM